MVQVVKAVEEVLEQAKKEADGKQKEAEAQVAEWIDAAQKLGGKDGHVEARKLSQKLKIFEEKLGGSKQSEILKAALSVSGILLEDEIKTNSLAVISILKRAIANIPEAGRIMIRVSPANIELLKTKKEELLDGVDQKVEFEIKPDKRVELGGVIIHTESGVVDAQPKTQLAELSRLLLS